jgi:rRNA pseudouridine-1189 N-methylase Emg1 (Nep1/Mra1 family)
MLITFSENEDDKKISAKKLKYKIINKPLYISYLLCKIVEN